MNIARSTLASALLIGFVSQPVLAEPVEEAPTRTVSYRDLDLTRARDVIRLERRIASAVKRVCGVERPIRTSAQTACVRTALERSRPAVELAVRDSDKAYARAGLGNDDAAQK